MSDNPVNFLRALADECERSGQEYGKGRAEGIRETLRELDNFSESLFATIADLREKLRVAGEALRLIDNIAPPPENAPFDTGPTCRQFLRNAKNIARTAIRAAGGGGEQKGGRA